MPDPEPDGYFVKTLNSQGFMGAYVSDPYMRGFIEFSASTKKPALDIGAAYGVATLPALALGASVIANDCSKEQLEILFERVPLAQRSHLTLAPGLFPGELNFEQNSLGSILIARVLHFFDGEKLIQALQKCHEWLIPSGRIFITAETPYLKNISSFIPKYEERRKKNALWPGWVTDFPKWDTRQGLNLPEQMHLLDEEVLSRELKKFGFKMIEARKFARPEFPESLRLDGRESVGIIAEKR